MNKKSHKAKSFKTIRIRCFKPTKRKRDLLLLTMRRARKCANYITQKSLELKITSKNILHRETYKGCMRYNIPTALIQSQRDKVVEAIKSWESNGKTGSPPHWHGIPSMRLDKRTLYWSGNSDKQIVSITTVKGRVRLPIQGKVKNEWLENTSSYDLVWSHRHQTFFIHLHVKREIQIPKWKNIKYILAFDNNFGRIVCVITDMMGKVVKTRFFHLGRLNEKHRRFLEARKSLQKKLGCRSVIKKIGNKEARFANDFCHKVSRQIVNMASEFENCAIFTEDLKDITNRCKNRNRSFNRRLHQMAFNKINTFVDYKATHSNIKTFFKIHSYGNSKSCSHCGSLKTVRNGTSFKCKCCGNREDADFNAAVNIAKRALRYIRKVAGIGESCPLTGRLDTATHGGVQA